jgi:hypothetical protein
MAPEGKRRSKREGYVRPREGGGEQARLGHTHEWGQGKG